jgi:hypothetical protein
MGPRTSGKTPLADRCKPIETVPPALVPAGPERLAKPHSSVKSFAFRSRASSTRSSHNRDPRDADGARVLRSSPSISRGCSATPRGGAALPQEGERGMPGARRTRGLVCKIVRRDAHEHTGSAETLRHSPRNGLTAYAALSPATNSSCHRRQRIDGLPEPGRADLPPRT